MVAQQSDPPTPLQILQARISLVVREMDRPDAADALVELQQNLQQAPHETDKKLIIYVDWLEKYGVHDA